MLQILTWYLVILTIGVIFWPVTGLIFNKWKDRGWLVSKALGVFVSAVFLWVMNCLKIISFSRTGCFIAFVFLAILSTAALLWNKKKMNGTLFVGTAGEFEDSPAKISIRLIAAEELIFIGLFFLCVWIVGFRPAAYGTEKFMDYGFLTAILRSEWMPFEDTWYSGEKINYYYGGQYITAFLIRLSGVSTGYGYNLMRAFITTMSFGLPFAISRGLMSAFLGNKKEGSGIREDLKEVSVSRNGLAKKGSSSKKAGGENEKQSTGNGLSIAKISVLTGVLSGFAVAFCGNFHYVIYGIILPIYYKIIGQDYSYWFPDSTRYIGYNPDTNDKTIHEFPAYSSVLGDLHAHYINLVFVLTVVAILTAWAIGRVKDKECRTNLLLAVSRQDAVARRKKNNGKGARERTSENGSGIKRVAGERSGKEERLTAILKENLLNPAIILMGFMTGVFRWTNFWDCPIYLVVVGAVILFVQWRIYQKKPLVVLSVVIAQLIEIVILGYVAALPFTLSFDMISSEIKATTSHTAFYQLLILWGLPTACVIAFFVLIMAEHGKRQREKALAGNSLPGNRQVDTAAFGANNNAMKGANGQRLSGDAGCFNEEGSENTGCFNENTENKEVPDVKAQGEKDNPFVRFGHGFMMLLTEIPITDLLVLIYGVAGLGLVLLPELIYVKDIYGGQYYRSNTMFKLTFQAFILLGLSMGYIIMRLLMKEKKAPRIIASIALVILVLTGGYTIQSVYSWFGNIFETGNRVGTDATSYLQSDFSTDEGAINWLMENADSGDVVLEAHGASYSACERVSVTTGLPTVAGWFTHEWLWRNDLDALNQRIADVETIYTSDDADEVKALIEKYNIKYIYIGQTERDTYGTINDELLQSIGTVAYSDGVTTYIMKVS